MPSQRKAGISWPNLAPPGVDDGTGCCTNKSNCPDAVAPDGCSPPTVALSTPVASGTGPYTVSLTATVSAGATVTWIADDGATIDTTNPLSPVITYPAGFAGDAVTVAAVAADQTCRTVASASVTLPAGQPSAGCTPPTFTAGTPTTECPVGSPKVTIPVTSDAASIDWYASPLDSSDTANPLNPSFTFSAKVSGKTVTIVAVAHSADGCITVTPITVTLPSCA